MLVLNNREQQLCFPFALFNPPVGNINITYLLIQIHSFDSLKTIEIEICISIIYLRHISTKVHNHIFFRLFRTALTVVYTKLMKHDYCNDYDMLVIAILTNNTGRHFDTIQPTNKRPIGSPGRTLLISIIIV